jgi:hypothetical protein
VRPWRIICVGVVAIAGVLCAACSQTPKAGQGDLYTCGRVAYWNNYIVLGKDTAGGRAAPAQITSGAQRAKDFHLRRQGAQLNAHYAAGGVKAAIADIATLTATCEQWAKMGPPGS